MWKQLSLRTKSMVIGIGSVLAILWYAVVKLGPVTLVLVAIAVPVLFWARFALLPMQSLSTNRRRQLRTRLFLRAHPGRGFATRADLFFRFGRWKVLKESGRIRPDLGFWYRLWHPDAYSTLVGRAHQRIKVRISHQTHVLALSVPRTGKTAWLARTILHHPGAVISTSSQPDVFKYTSGARARRGRVHVLNPSGLGAVTSTFRWSISDGCDDEATAIRRADALIGAVSAGGSDNGDFFKSKASDAMRAMLIAAAVDKLDFRAIANWIFTGKMAEPITILEKSGRHHFAGSLAELVGKAEKTAATTFMMLSRAIQFALDPALLEAVLPVNGDGLDIETLLRNGETLYLIAPVNGDDSPLGGLFAALVSEIHHVARQVAATMPGGRLSPVALYALDELCQCAPIPAASWAADAGGRGVQLIIVSHGQAQLEGKFGKAAMRTILDCCSAKLTYGGISDTGTLQELETLSGTVAIREHGHDSHARHPICSVDMLREMPDGYALLVSGNSAPVIVRPPRVWRDPLYRRLKLRGQAVAQLQPAPAPQPLHQQKNGPGSRDDLPPGWGPPPGDEGQEGDAA
jgi:type IV secretion system protein VirD4